MDLHKLTKNKTLKKVKRIGRGNSSGSGTYCGRGMKGMGQRKSGHVRPGFEGGQTPLLKRLPKLKGFKNYNRVSYQVVNLSDLEKLDSKVKEIDKNLLYELGLISKKALPVKILAKGELKKKFTFTGQLKFSKTARNKILENGGKII